MYKQSREMKKKFEIEYAAYFEHTVLNLARNRNPCIIM